MSVQSAVHTTSLDTGPAGDPCKVTAFVIQSMYRQTTGLDSVESFLYRNSSVTRTIDIAEGVSDSSSCLNESAALLLLPSLMESWSRGRAAMTIILTTSRVTG